MIRPAALRPGDTIAILSPASIINPDYVKGASTTIERYGYRPMIMPNTLGQSGSYSGSEAERLDDLTSALQDPNVRAIICSRGGYGAVHLLSQLDQLPLDRDPKWLVGFSDISALHALWASKGIISIHAPMTRQLAEASDSETVRRLFAIMQGESQTLNWSATPEAGNRSGKATGQLRGGNMAVLEGLAGTHFENYPAGSILFIEDVGEPIYKIERMLYRMRLSGVLTRINGLIVGRFTEYTPDRNHSSMEKMIALMTADLQIPIAFNAPIGHIGADNMPIAHGATASLEVATEGATLTF